MNKNHQSLHSGGTLIPFSLKNIATVQPYLFLSFGS